MSPERFDHLLTLVSPKIAKKDTSFRKSIPAAERLALTLKYLATGDAQQSLSYSFRISKSSVSRIISETCEAIYASLAGKYLSPPTTQSNWLAISRLFEELVLNYLALYTTITKASLALCFSPSGMQIIASLCLTLVSMEATTIVEFCLTHKWVECLKMMH